MATVAGIKIKNKVAKTRNPLFMDEKYTGGEPEWPEGAAEWDEARFDNRLRKSFYYYNYYYSQKDCKKYVSEWMKASGKYAKEDIKVFDRASDKSISMTACSLIMAHRAGMPFRSRHIEFLTSNIAEAINKADPEQTTETVTPSGETVEVYKPTIQDRLAERTSEIIGELEGIYDNVHNNIKVDFKPYDFLTSRNVVQNQLGKYEELFIARKTELELAQSKTDEQLKEGYSNYKAADFKRMIGWIDALLAAIEQYRDVKKATKKARVKKAPSKEKLIAKLKYSKEDKSLKIVSINPADIVGASELWIYNVKTRKLGKYVADSLQGPLSVKGTSIIGFDTAKSVCKTLRKPEEKLKEFAKASKVQLRKFLEEIKATDTKLNGRISTDIVLLRVA